jgi:hypothetical protein
MRSLHRLGSALELVAQVTLGDKVMRWDCYNGITTVRIDVSVAKEKTGSR